MRSATLLIAALTAALTAACFGGPASTATTTPGMPAQGPTHAPTTPEQWAALESAARTAVEKAGMEDLGSADRLIHSGFNVTHELELAEGTCYEAGLAWAYPAKTHVSINYQPAADGSMPNDQLGATGGQLEGGVGNVRFCSDHAGTAILNLSSLGPSGAITNNELLEYALVVGSHQETAEETTTRRAEEAARGAAAGAQIEANIAAAEERERQRMARVCRDCGDALILCRSQRAAGNQPSGNSCELDFQLCPFNGFRSDYERAKDKAPCGTP